MGRIGRAIKVGVGMMKYSLAVKMNLVLMILFMVLGIFYEVMMMFSSGESSPVAFNGIWMLALAPMYAIQLMYGISLSGVVQSSSAKRTLLVDSSTVFKAISEILSFLILVIARIVACNKQGGANSTMLFGLVFYGIFSLVLSVYTVVIYRYPVIGYAVLLPLLIIMMVGAIFVGRDTVALNPVRVLDIIGIGNNFTVCLAIGSGIIVLDIVLFYVLSAVLYKVPLSERAFKQLLARAK